MSNFSFLQTYWPDFAQIMQFAENYVYTDPASSKNKSGLFVELMVREILRIENLPEPEEKSHYARTKLLKNEGLLPFDVNQWINQVRIRRNDSAHENKASEQEAMTILGFTHHIAVWFMQVYGDGSFRSEPFVKPERPKRVPDYTRLVLNQERKIEEQNEAIANKESELAETNALLAERDKLLAEQQAIIEKLTKEREAQKVVTPQSTLTKQDRQHSSAAAISNTKLTEDETRKLIDDQLRKVGWEADTVNLRYSKGTRPQKGRKIAIAEWPVKSTKTADDRADYALFVDEQLIGIIEAKAYEKSVYAIIDNQCHEYAKNVKDEDEHYCLGKWQSYKVPFVFATNGRPYLKQIETESGIWFQDLRKESNISYALQGWYSPEDLLAKFKQNVDEADQKLENLPYDFLRDPDGLNFRYYQLEAVSAVEKAVVNGQQRILLAMATGTGKTRTILGMVYRFLKTNRFRRILFLVDRTALGEQAQDVFNDVKLEDLQPLNKIYNINTLDNIDLASETRIQVATVQGMIARIMSDDKERIPSSGDFDCIIIDEAHRGYTLDRELSEAELLYRDQNDFVSKYKKVIEYFDAVKIGLTATPALHTTQIFGNAVYTYSYREAVIDGYLVDYDAPHIIKTELNQHGIHHNKGESLAKYNPVTKELLNPEELEDEVNFDVEEFNKNVLTPSFNKVVLTELSKYIDPESDEKAVIFAVNDRHADEIVKQLRDIYSEQDVPSAAIEKITCAIGDRGRVQDAIKRFKNEHFPTIAVTVDLLSTGIDVPEITKIVFMRRIKSRILYEQMLGRATRLCPKINKTHFDIYDAVDLYSYLDEFSSMKPVVSNPSVTFDELYKGYEKVSDEEHIKFINEQIIAKFQRVKRQMDESQLNYFKVMSHYDSPDDFISKVRQAKAVSEENCKEELLRIKDAFGAFKIQKSTGRYVIVSNKQDEVREVARGFGKGQEPEDYLESFSKYLDENRNKIDALEIVCTRPADLTLADLRKLSMTLDANGYNTIQLNTAVQKVTNEECAADIITLVRRYAIGSPLISHEERIHNAIKKLNKAHNFTAGEKKWIDRIEKYLINESVLNVQTFDEYMAWRNQGGFAKVNKIFNNQLSSIIKDLNTYLYAG
ncbi:MAG: type I restriction-modification system endonuclease [Treponema sp.]|nr:type I restriction-modification system endonuclease [Treponema sp.]